MNTRQRQQVKAAIDAAMSEAQDDIASLQEKTQPIQPDVSLGRITRMEAIGEKSILEANLRQAQQRLAGLRAARAKVDGDDFGDCEACGESIPLARILLLPHTQYCVHCAD